MSNKVCQGFVFFVFFVLGSKTAVMMTDLYDCNIKTKKMKKNSIPSVFENLHIINISSCSALQDFIWNLQVWWDFWVL